MPHLPKDLALATEDVTVNLDGELDESITLAQGETIELDRLVAEQRDRVKSKEGHPQLRAVTVEEAGAFRAVQMQADDDRFAAVRDPSLSRYVQRAPVGSEV